VRATNTATQNKKETANFGFVWGPLIQKRKVHGTVSEGIQNKLKATRLAETPAKATTDTVLAPLAPFSKALPWSETIGKCPSSPSSSSPQSNLCLLFPLLPLPSFPLPASPLALPFPSPLWEPLPFPFPHEGIEDGRSDTDGMDEIDGWEEGVSDGVPDGMDEIDGWAEGVSDGVPDGMEDIDGWEEGVSDGVPDGMDEIDGWEEGCTDTDGV
jgi:hypothetical protein